MLDSNLNGYPVYIYSFMKSGFNVKIISIKNIYYNVFFLIAEYLTFIKAYVTPKKMITIYSNFQIHHMLRIKKDKVN